MHYGNIPGVAKPVARLVQGTASGFDPKNDEEAFALLDLALGNGFNTFDTAENYGPAREIVFGKWIRTRGVREQVVVIAKGAHPYDGHNRVTPEDIAADMTQSQERMQLDYFDLYVLHRDDPSVPVGPIVEALNAHQKAGRIGAFGGSNWTHTRIREANEYAKAHGLTPFAVSSPNFSLAEQYHEPWDNCVSISGPQGKEARQYYAAGEVALLPWSSLASGFFSGRFQRDNLDTFNKNDYWAQLVIRCYCGETNFQRLGRVQTLAQAKSLTPAQVGLSFVLNQPINTFALTMCADQEQFTANTAALDIKLTPQEMAYLDLKGETP